VRGGPVEQGADERVAGVLHVLRGWMGAAVFCGFVGVAECFDDSVRRGGVIGWLRVVIVASNPSFLWQTLQRYIDDTPSSISVPLEPSGTLYPRNPAVAQRTLSESSASLSTSPSTTGAAMT